MSAVMVKRTDSPYETEDAGYDIAGGLKPRDVVALYGELGSGKTCFVRGIARRMNVKQTVKSPSYNIINEYEGAVPLYHMDFYRLHRLPEIEDTGWAEYMTLSGVVIIEWADRVKNMLPEKRMDVYFEILDKNSRSLRIVTDDGPGN